MIVFVPIPCCFDYFIFPVLSEVWEGYASRYVIFPQDCSRNSGPFMVLYTCEGASLVAHLPSVWETWAPSLGGKIPWRRAWKSTPVFMFVESPQTEEPGGLQSMGSQRVRHNWLSTTQHIHFRIICSSSMKIFMVIW